MHIQVRRARLVGVISVLCLAASGLVLSGGQASADTAPPAGTPATVSADALPTWQVNGVVWSQVVVGNTVYVTGSFTKARPPGVVAGGAGEVTANNIFAYDITTGNRVASFTHSLNGQGLDIARSPDGSRVYVVGDFTTVDGLTRSHIAAFDTATNAVITSFAPTVSATVSAVTVSADTVWFGGNFFNVNGSGRTRLAAVRASNGTNLAWAPKADDDEVASMVLTPDKSRVIIGGKFRTLNGVSAPGMGSVDATSGANLPWAANQKINDSGNGSAITSLSTDGTNIYGTGFAYQSGNFEGTFSADPGTGQLKFANDCHGDTYDAMPVGGVLYSVSHAHDCRWIGSFPDQGQTNARRALAFTIAPNGRTNTGPDNYGWDYRGVPVSSLLQWFPKLAIGSFTKQYQAAWSVAGNDNYIVLGGEFPSVNGTAQQGLVRFAKRALAPNKRGPVRAAGAPTPTATAMTNGTIRLAWQAAYDMDNSKLTYDVYRSGTTSPVYTTTQDSNFWTYPMMGFSDPGIKKGTTYTYQVKVTDPLGNTISLPTTSPVTATSGAANASPQAAFTSTANGLAVSFDATTSSDSDGTVNGYDWDWGDATSHGSGVSPNHTYTSAGTYHVTLTVTDDKGATGTVSHDVTATAPGTQTPLAADGFERTQATGWGPADRGGSWAIGGSSSRFSVGNGVGSINLATPGSGPSANLDGVSSTRTDTTVTLSANKAPTGAGIFTSVIGREVPAGGAYRADLNLRSDGSVSLGTVRVAADGTETDVSPSIVVPGLTYTPGGKLNLRFVVSGSGTTTLKAKVWAAGANEPVNWIRSGTDSTAGFQSAGTVGVMAYLSSSATNAPVRMDFDNFATVTALD